MRSYFCYIHTPATATPQMRVVNAESVMNLREVLQDAMHEWPRYDRIDIFDELDQAVLRVVAGGSPQSP